MNYIQRSIEPLLKRAVTEFPAVVVTGPRQSGKTTLLKHLCSKTHKYVSLEAPDVHSGASEDPRGFLSVYPPPVILDEIQYAPDLLFYIKEWIDQNREAKGQFLVTGSQNLLLSEKVTESLAGRAAILRLLPLSRREIEGCPDEPFPPDESGFRTKAESTDLFPWAAPKLWEKLLLGGFPELVADPARDVRLWFSSYVQTYLERDVRSIRQVGDLTTYQSFMKSLAARSGSLLNIADLSRDLGVALNTVKTWLSVLEATYQISIVRPYHQNVGKRLVKSPKVYFTDVGMLCHLAGLRDPEHAASGPMAGAIFETAVHSEILKNLLNEGENPEIHFWRTTAGTEVDFLVRCQDRWIPIEVKTTSTPKPAISASLRSLPEKLGNAEVAPGFLIHTGETVYPLGEGVIGLPFALF